MDTKGRVGRARRGLPRSLQLQGATKRTETHGAQSCQPHSGLSAPGTPSQGRGREGELHSPQEKPSPSTARPHLPCPHPGHSLTAQPQLRGPNPSCLPEPTEAGREGCRVRPFPRTVLTGACLPQPVETHTLPAGCLPTTVPTLKINSSFGSTCLSSACPSGRPQPIPGLLSGFKLEREKVGGSPPPTSAQVAFPGSPQAEKGRKTV